MREDGVPSWQLTLLKDKLNTLEYWEFNADTGVLLEHSSTATTDNRRDTGTGQQSASRQTPTGQGREE